MTEILSARFLDLADINLSVKLLEKRTYSLYLYLFGILQISTWGPWGLKESDMT